MYQLNTCHDAVLRTNGRVRGRAGGRAAGARGGTWGEAGRATPQAGAPPRLPSAGPAAHN